MSSTHEAWKLCRTAKLLAVSFKLKFSSMKSRFKSGLIRSHSSSGGALLRVALTSTMSARRKLGMECAC